MTRQKPRNRWIGIVSGLAFFAFLGFPYFLLSLMGHRACDYGSGPPCATSREMAQLQTLAVVAGISVLVGLIAHLIANRPRQSKTPVSAFD